MLSLEERRTALQHELEGVQQQLSALHSRLLGGAPVAVSPPVAAALRAKPAPRRQYQRGVLGEKILGALTLAGQAGLRVRDLAAQIGTKAPNIHSWLQSTAKKHPGIRKVAAGLYRLTPGTAPVAAAAKAKAKGGKKGKGGKRGALSAGIMAALEAAGAAGISVRDLAEKAGSHYKNVSIWFATTGKKNGKVRKVGPARYKLVA